MYDSRLMDPFPRFVVSQSESAAAQASALAPQSQYRAPVRLVVVQDAPPIFQRLVWTHHVARLLLGSTWTIDELIVQIPTDNLFQTRRKSDCDLPSSDPA